ncbi:hypothetical protein SCHPADRAFT_888124 [Schizopora paradoxa]|uniref:F-box domain-containing protein n=1 Tax=Schizopora paradoxa TaxID=27342 RepID=A0A0H2RWI8_9AGAM|nr:hypothetical protein SCHPADRAFT_888124 [Schizopora paradoxa]
MPLTGLLEKLHLNNGQGRENSTAPDNRSLLERFPQDILYTIFLACLPTNLASKKLLMESPLNFSLVCRSWRSVVLLYPSLWADFELHVCNSEEFDAGWVLKRLKRCLKLSKDALLTASLDVSNGVTQRMDRVVQCLLEEEHRWERIHITVLDNSIPWPIPSIQCQSSLRLLQLRGTARGEPGNDLSICIDGTESSNLRCVKAIGRFAFVASGDLPNLQHIEYIPVNLQGGGRFLSFLRSASSIVQLDMSLNIMPTSDPQTMVVLSRLEKLNLDCKGFRVDQASFFFNNISFPSLSTLKLRSCQISGNISTWIAIGEAYRRSNPPLQNAQFQAVAGSSTTSSWSDECVREFANLLRTMKQLTHLDVHGGLVTDTLLERLSLRDGMRAAICPELESLALGCPWLPFLSESPVIGLIKSRWEMKVQSFKLCLRCKMTQPHIGHVLEDDEILKCVNQGLELLVA